jgi:hypothetical protein
MAGKGEQRTLDVHVPEDVRRGVYANNLVVAHTKEEFVMDFILLAADEAVLTSRVITSPAHMKRILGAIQHNVEAYERTHGTIEEGDSEPGAGFSTPTRH